MAGPHVTGLAALILAHHPDFKKPPYDKKDAQRVDRLFQILKATAQPLSLGSSERTGAGLPDAVRAFSQAVGQSTTTPSISSGSRSDKLRKLRELWS
jgi:hypothetical protein